MRTNTMLVVELSMVKLSIFVLFSILVTACSDRDQYACRSPEDIGLVSLSTFVSNKAEVEAVLSELAANAESADDFFVEFTRSGSLYSANLWHKSAFYPENCGMVGNPGGLSRTYRIADGRVIEELGWL